jgi:modulator of FtsH protease HflC
MVDTLRRNRWLLLFVAFLAVLVASSLKVVGEDQQVVIEQMGRPDRVINRFRPGDASGAGLIAVIPLYERAIALPRGLIGYSQAGKRVRNADQQWLLVDTDLTYRIIDPVKLVSTLGSADKIEAQLQALLPGLLDSELSQRGADLIVRPGAGAANAALLHGLDGRTRQFGIQIVDLRLARVLPDEAGLQSVYRQMDERLTAQVREIEYRSYNDTVDLTTKAEAEAATRIQRSAAQDRDFYAFYTAMQSYAALYGDPKRPNTATIVLPPDSGYLKHFGGK